MYIYMHSRYTDTWIRTFALFQSLEPQQREYLVSMCARKPLTPAGSSMA